jgi:hypothetical protein
VQLFGLRDFSVDLSVVLDQLTALPPHAFKSMSRGFWGLFAMRRPVIGASYAGGERVKKWTIKNRFQHMPWATLITHRVMRRVWRATREADAVVYVDSVVVPHQLEAHGIDVSNALGAWRRVESFPNGIFVAAPGQWTGADVIHNYKHKRPPVTPDWHRHAGVSDRQWIDERFGRDAVVSG